MLNNLSNEKRTYLNPPRPGKINSYALPSAALLLILRTAELPHDFTKWQARF